MKWYNKNIMNKKTLKTLIIILVIFGGIIAWQLYHYNHQPRPQVKGIVEIRKNLTVDFFDVGQGDSELIRTPQGQDILIDGGPDNKVMQKLGAALPLLDRDIELMILSHPHSDHVTGLNEVIRSYDVKKIMMTGFAYSSAEYREFLNLIKEKNIPVEIVNQVENVALEPDLDLRILFPDTSLVHANINNPNNTSIAAKLTYVSTSYLFTGDFENEEIFLRQTSTRELLHSTVLKVGHHGSGNANDLEYLKAVNPVYAVISVGAKNSYGLPSYRVIHDLEKLGAKVWRTDLDGDISLISDGHKVERMGM